MASPGLAALLKKLKIPAWIIVGLISLYAISGFWIAPYLIKSKLPALLEENLGRTGAIQEISINPFLFKVDLKGFTIQRKQGGRFVGFDEFFIDFELSSLIKRAVTFDQIRLIGLFVEVDKLKGGGFNFDDLLSSSEKEEPEAEDADSSPFPLWISQVDIREGQIVFNDESRKKPFHIEISPINLSIANFQTFLDSGSQYQFKANIESGGSFDWKGNINITPLYSKGTIKLSGFKPILIWRYIQDTVNFELVDGAFDLSAQYGIHQQSDSIQVEVREGQYSLENLKIAPKGTNNPLIDIPRLSLDGIHFDLLEQRLAIASLSSEKAKINAWVRPDKEMNFVDLFRPVADSPPTTSPPPADSTDSSDNPNWLITVNEIALNDYDFLFEDRSLASTMRLDFNPLNVTLKNFSSEMSKTLPFTIKTAINKTGHLNVTGDLGLQPVSTLAKLDLKLNLTDFQPYIDPVTKFEFGQGDALVNGDVDFKLDQDSNPQLGFKGMASIEDFLGQDKLHKEKLLEWKALRFEGVDFNLDPITVAINEVIADRAFMRFVINGDGTTNLSRVFGEEPSTQSKTEKSASSKAKKTNDSPDPVVKVDTLTIKNASAYFADLSLKPKFATDMQGLNGAVRGLSTNKKSRAKIDLKGKADRTAPVRIKGQMQIFDPESYTDIGLDFKNLSLTSLTPYSGKFAGYKIEKGKLAVDLKYKIDGKKLAAENKVVIKQLTLGDEVESPDAVSLPLSLAIALLQDADGVINLDLPLSGSLDDPEFSIWGTVGDVLFNLITKVVTSPFAALGSLIDGDEELDNVTFVPGQTDIAEEEQAKLAKVVDALEQRPALNIEIEGVANDLDAAEQFKKAALSKKIAALPKPEPAEESQAVAPQPEPTLTDEDFRRYLLQSYYMQIAGMKHLSLNAPMIEQNLNSEDVLRSARRKVYGTILSEDAAIRDLAQTRAGNVREYLIAQNLNPDRIFMLDVNLEMDEDREPDAEDSVPSKLSLTTD